MGVRSIVLLAVLAVLLVRYIICYWNRDQVDPFAPAVILFSFILYIITHQ